MYVQAAQMNGLISYLAIYIGFGYRCMRGDSVDPASNADGSRSYRVCWRRSAATTARSAIR